MMDFQTRRRLTLKAAAQAEKVRVKCKQKQADPVDPITVAEERGCEVRFMSLPSLEGIYSPEPRSILVLGSERHAGRRVFTCAHELGHHEFKHGMRVEELHTGGHESSNDVNEFLADMFAGTLLMPKVGVLHALNTRNFDLKEIQSIQLFRLASFFGVGYGTLIEHMTWTLSLLTSPHRKELLKTAPKAIKAVYGCEPKFGLVIADEGWKNRAIDLEVGDSLVLPIGATVEDGIRLEQQDVVDGQPIYKALKRGYSRSFSGNSEWAAHIRIAPRNYEGMAKYRFLDDPDAEVS